MNEGPNSVGTAVPTIQAVFVAQTSVAVLLMVATFVAPHVFDPASATVTRSVVIAAALAVACLLLFGGSSARRWSVVIAMAACVSGIVLIPLGA